MKTFKVELFEDFRILENGISLELPPSKKARALLAYLIVANRPQRREHLCDMFWEGPRDPKGSLRWALSKLKQVFSDENKDRLIADRERVAFDLRGAPSQTDIIETLIEQKLPTKSVYLSARRTFENQFLGGIDLPNLNQFSLWLADQRAYADLQEGRLIEQCLQ